MGKGEKGEGDGGQLERFWGGGSVGKFLERGGVFIIRFSFLLYIFLDSIKPVRFGPVQSV